MIQCTDGCLDVPWLLVQPAEETLAPSYNNHEEPVQDGDVICATSGSSLTLISTEGTTLHPRSISTQSEQDDIQTLFYPLAEPPTSHEEGRGEAVEDNYTEFKKNRNKQPVRLQTVEIF